MTSKASRIALLLLCLASAALAGETSPFLGKPQEKADVVFRALKDDWFGKLNMHSGIYLRYFGDEVEGGRVDSPNFHRLIEQDVGGVRDLTLGVFINDADNHIYHGARTSRVLQFNEKRDEIGALAISAEMRAIPYVGTKADAFTKMVIWDKDLPIGNGDNVMDYDEIGGLRSDAWVEYVYARAGVFIQDDIIHNTAFYTKNEGAPITDLLPKNQYAAMFPATIIRPLVTVKENTDSPAPLPPSGGVTTDHTPVIEMSDTLSGGSQLEVWLGQPGTGQIVFGNIADFQGVRTYQPGPLADGLYSVRGVDQAGNVTVVSFTIVPPKLTLQTIAPPSPQQMVFDALYGWESRLARILATNANFSFACSLSSVAVTDASGNRLPLTNISPAGADSLNLGGISNFSASVQNLTPGQTYTVQGVDQNGSETRATWSVEQLGVSLSPASHVEIDGTTGMLTDTMVLGFSGSQDLLRMEQFDPDSHQLLHSVGLRGQSDTKTYRLAMGGPAEGPPFFNASWHLQSPDGFFSALTPMATGFSFYLRDVVGDVAKIDITPPVLSHWYSTATAYPWDAGNPVLGTVETSTYDLTTSGFLPSAIMGIGGYYDWVNSTWTWAKPVQIEVQELGVQSSPQGVPIGGPHVIGRVTFSVFQGDSPDQLAGGPILDYELDANGLPFADIHRVVPLKRFFKLVATVEKTAPTSIFIDRCVERNSNDTICYSGMRPVLRTA